MIRRGDAETAPKMQGESLLHRPVGWLPVERLTRSFLKSSFVVANSGAHLSSFSSFCWEGERCIVVEPDVGTFEGQESLELLALLTFMDFLEQGPSLRDTREKIESVLLARRLTARLAELPERPLLVAAAAHRTKFLKAVDAGAPLPAGEVRQMVFAVPGCLTALGHALPTAEAVDLLHRFGPVLEVGAGIGLWARALVQAGIDVVASDIGTGERIGLSGHVLKGWSASRALASPLSRGRSLLMLWPTITHDGWMDQAVASLERGSVLLVGSPELDFMRDLIRLHGDKFHSLSGLLREAGTVLRRLADCFAPLGDAPIASASPHRLDVRLRAYERM
jgi:hypothetical protein